MSSARRPWQALRQAWQAFCARWSADLTGDLDRSLRPIDQLAWWQDAPEFAEDDDQTPIVTLPQAGPAVRARPHSGVDAAVPQPAARPALPAR